MGTEARTRVRPIVHRELRVGVRDSEHIREKQDDLGILHRNIGWAHDIRRHTADFLERAAQESRAKVPSTSVRD